MLSRIKLRLLRQVVRENIDTIQGRWPRSLRPGHRILRAWSRRLLWVVVGVLASAYVISPIASDRRETIFFSPPVPKAVGTRLPSLVLSAPLSPASTLPTPQPIDPTVLPLGVHKIVLDPGHGGEELGTVAPLGIVEKEVTLDIGHRLRRLLEEASFEVSMTRETDKSVSLKERVRFSRTAGGDIFISIHVNWIETRKTRGVETYYLGTTDDPFLTELAATENRRSGYSLVNFRRLLEGIYLDVKQGESRKLARAVQRELFRSLSKINPALENRGVKTAPFIVLNGTESPAILVEVSCLSNEEEARLLANPDYRQNIAQAIFKAIHSYTMPSNVVTKKEAES